MGIPGSGKTTLSSLISRHFEVEHLHVSQILAQGFSGHWQASSGRMAPEPAATRMILVHIGMRIDRGIGFVVDGFPRDHRQWNALQSWMPVVFLECSTREALSRLNHRGRLDMTVERYRIREQSRLLSPIRGLAALRINTTQLTPEMAFEHFDHWWSTGDERWTNY